MSDNNSLLPQFFQEVLELLPQAEELVLELEQYGPKEERVHSLFRLFHTLKGNSNMVGEATISDLTHALEEEYDEVRSGRGELKEDLLQSTFEVIDVLVAVAQEGDSGPFLKKLRALTERLGSRKRTDTPTADGAVSGTVLPTPEEARQTVFSEWKTLLRKYYRVNDLAEALKKGEEDPVDQLMDLGMECIDLRTSAEGKPPEVNRKAVYLEKFVATLTREGIPYNEISYELLYMLLSDLKKEIWERLFVNGALVYTRIVTMEELKRVEEQLKDDRKLWILDLAFSSSNVRRSNDFFTKMAELKKRARVPVIFISSHSMYYQKATALLDLALDGFPRVADNIEEGIKMYLAAEEQE